MKKKNQNIDLMKCFLPYLSKYKGALILDLFCAALTTVCELVLPMIVRMITQKGFEDLSSLTVSLVLKVTLFYILLRVIDAAASYYMSGGGHIMGTKIETDMRNDLFSHLQTLSYSYYDNVKVGQLMSRITNDLFEITEFAHHCPEEFFIAGIKIVASFIILSTINLPLTLLMFALFPVMLLFTARFRKRMREAFKAQRNELGEINSVAEDSLLGIRVVKSYANEEVENKKFSKGNRKFFKVKRQSYVHMAGFHTTIRVFDGIMYIAVVAVGSLLIIGGSLGPADLTAFLLMASTLLGTIRRIVEFSEQFQRGMTGIERFKEIMDIVGETTDNENARPIADVQGEIKFENVSFSYTDGAENVLEGINIHMNKGDNIAIVGPSGGGKTTLCNLIPRFYDVTGGRILIDGTDITEITLDSLRQNIGVVQQDVYMFSGTVAQNIMYGNPDATTDEMREAAKKAGAHDFIESLPDGYNTYVGERGVKLSGGQKQRISIARVFLKNPPILILDEATSSLDNESEKLIQRSLEQLAKGRTTLTIAHRLTTIRNATKILVLTKDGITEQGTHKQLLEMDGIYKNLYQTDDE